MPRRNIAERHRMPGLWPRLRYQYRAGTGVRMIKTSDIINRELRTKPCPVCGRLPRVHRDREYEKSGYGSRCIIRCKRLFRKPHLTVEKTHSTWSSALWYGILLWNKAADEFSAT